MKRNDEMKNEECEEKRKRNLKRDKGWKIQMRIRIWKMEKKLKE